MESTERVGRGHISYSNLLLCMHLQSGNQLVRYEGDKRFTLRKEEIQCPEGWEWENPDGRWEICQKRNVNKQGEEPMLEVMDLYL